MPIFRVPCCKPSYFTYAMLARDAGNVYVKFGISKKVGARLSAVRTGCPLPIQYVAVLDVESKKRAIRVEKSLHAHFDARKMQGEWFRFAFTLQDEKKAFNDGCRAVFLLELGPGYWWTTISVAALDKYEKQRRKELLESKHFRLIQKRAIEEQKIKRAWEELRADPATA